MKKLADAGAAYLWSIVLMNVVSIALVLYILILSWKLMKLLSSSFAP